MWFFKKKKKDLDLEPQKCYSKWDELASVDFRERNPNTCPVIEKTADGIRCGICYFYLENGICPRHGKIK